MPAVLFLRSADSLHFITGVLLIVYVLLMTPFALHVYRLIDELLDSLLDVSRLDAGAWAVKCGWRCGIPEKGSPRARPGDVRLIAKLSREHGRAA